MSSERSSRPGRVAATLFLWAVMLGAGLVVLLWVVGAVVMDTIVSKNLPHE